MTGHGSCDEVNCGSPTLLPFGTFNYSSTTYGSPSHLLCNTGYRFAGTNNTITCRVDGTWDPISGSCDVVNCGSPALIRNGANNCSSSATTYGALCYLVCNTGYTFTGANDTISCTDAGDWGTYSGSCVADCGTPTVENAIVSYNGTIYGSKVRITCVNETFLYDGNASIKVVILKANEVKAEILFNGEGTTRTSWFSITQMINSTWTDLNDEATFNYFSIPGLGGHHRRFYINNLFNGCPGDIGWMLIKDKAINSPCDWEKTTTPTILFSKASTATLSTDWESADVMAVLAQLGSHD
ncbi:sushi, von Willebrand factor type A, EGF and pentraxin domain-containing protein 1-like [Haliotis rufescens]|uniref:sushi, von Willebrand factor type A, EGF and pentraxin domain-containing protein 1-like n=1 Tax=Haliotis rufescens TaxID=6454 RepID=UPI00201EA02E|nr:sushi, von Willebrand factor type A, EGF and pentraxin domain-containing protein 1-like [Haliotis rufescens]